MEFWENLYADELREFDMRTLMDYMKHNYFIPDTPGPQYEEILQIIALTNEDKASSGIIKPHILKVGSS